MHLTIVDAGELWLLYDVNAECRAEVMSSPTCKTTFA